MSAFVLILKAVLVLVPLIADMVKENKIKTAAEKEVLDVFEEEFKKRWDKRIADANAAANSVSDSNGNFENDPNDRKNSK